MQNTTEESGETPSTPAVLSTSVVGGGFIVGCAVAAAVAMVAPDTVVITDAPRVGWHYPPVMWPLLLTLAGAGAAVMARPRWARSAAVVAAIVAALVAGNGLSTIHRWFTVNGLGGLDHERHNLVALHAYATTVTLAATAAAVAAAALVWRERFHARRCLVPSRPGYVAAGAAVAVLLAIGDPPSGSPLLDAAQAIAAPAYALPWGAGLAAAGWLRGRAARAAVIAVAASAALCVGVMAGLETYAYYATPPHD